MNTPVVLWFLAFLCVVYGFYLVAFQSEGGTGVILDAAKLPAGRLGEGSPIFLYYPETGAAEVVEEAGRRFLRVTLQDPERYVGFGVLALGKPRNGVALRLRWRAERPLPSVQIDIREGKPEKLGEEFWEVFSRIVNPPGPEWETLEFPLEEIPPNEQYQPPGGEKDGRLDLEHLEAVAFTFPPGNGVSLDLERIELYQPGYSLAALVVLFGLGGLLSAAALRREAPRQEVGGPAAISFVPLTWEAWMLLGATGFLAAAVSAERLGWDGAAVLGVSAALLLAEGRWPAALRSSPWLSFRFVLPVGVAWRAQVELPPFCWLLLLLLGTLPAWQNLKSRWAVWLLSAVGGIVVLEAELVHAGRIPELSVDALGLALVSVTVISLLGIEALRSYTREEAYRLELRRREALSDALFEVVAEGILLIDPKSLRVVRANRGAAELLGRDLNDLLKRRLDEVVSSPELQELVQAADREPVIRELEIPLEDSETRPVEALVQAFEFADVRLALVLLRSLEERRRVEEQVRHALKSEAIGRLAGGMAHEFNNLLMVINGNAELLLADSPRESPAFRYGEEIHRAGTKAARLVSELLAYSRRQLLQPTVLDPRDVLAGIRRMLGRVLGEKVRLEVSAAEDVPVVRADRRHLEQAFLYLAENARDAMPQGGEFRVHFGRTRLPGEEARILGLREGDYLLVEVSDTGSGIAPEVLEHIFDPFFTTKEVGKGPGLGLASVDGIIRQHGGAVTVDSKLGRGTTFRLLLPAYEVSAELAGEAG
ncbi:MAG: hypothetical protein Kow00109_10200 [Acidobacteriota bacterium]